MYDQAIAINPNNTGAYHNKGCALFNSGRIEEAIDMYNQALAINPDQANAYNDKGLALFDLGKNEEAIEAYNQALLMESHLTLSYINKGHVLYNLGKNKEAFELFEKGLMINPNVLSEYLKQGAVINALGNNLRAFQYFDLATKIALNEAEPYLVSENNFLSGFREDEDISKMFDEDLTKNDISFIPSFLLEITKNEERQEQSVIIKEFMLNGMTVMIGLQSDQAKVNNSSICLNQNSENPKYKNYNNKENDISSDLWKSKNQIGLNFNSTHSYRILTQLYLNIQEEELTRYTHNKSFITTHLSNKDAFSFNKNTTINEEKEFLKLLSDKE